MKDAEYPKLDHPPINLGFPARRNYGCSRRFLSHQHVNVMTQKHAHIIITYWLSPLYGRSDHVFPNQEGSKTNQVMHGRSDPFLNPSVFLIGR